MAGHIEETDERRQDPCRSTKRPDQLPRQRHQAQVDNRGEPVPPGVYLVRGGLNLGPPNAGPPGVLVTTAQKVEVLK